jgi:hypothetical protein
MNETNEGYQPSSEEIQKAEDMLTPSEKTKTESREKHLAQIEKLKEMGREEYRRKSKELAIKIADLIVQVKPKVAEESQKADEEMQKINISAIRFERGFETANDENADPISIPTYPFYLNQDWPLSLLSAKENTWRTDRSVEMNRDLANEPTPFPIYFKLWEEVLKILSPEEKEMAELIWFKQNGAQGIFEQ